MMRLYCPELRAGTVELPPEEAHHAAAVLRAKVGAEVTLIDGQGHEATGTISRIARRGVVVAAGDVRTRPFDCVYRLTIAIALGKAHRQSYVIEKCTELGVAAIWPLITERSVTRPGEAAVEKWSRRAIEAAKQSGRAFVPLIEQPQSFAAILGRTQEFNGGSIADVGVGDQGSEAKSPSPLAKGGGRGVGLPQSTIDNRQTTSLLASVPFLDFLQTQALGAQVLCLIGPEGGWSDAERDAARAAGLTFVRLAPTILRTETAAVTVCAAAALRS
jgi:16S rRNA (uracil1498-N3)-methyltransferase